MFYAVILAILVALLVTVGIVTYLYMRKTWREQKNYERGLKMVPLLIHQPPQSADIEVGGRDERDVLDETISRAQTLYDIIASSFQKGFKSSFYGQRHLGFEIVGQGGFVHFYAIVPVSMIELVEQAVTSAYPSARLEEVPDHNIFSTTGKSLGTVGGELTLKEDASQPVATYQEMRRDSMRSLLNAFSGMEKEDGAAIQILFRPANSMWRKNALAKAEKKRKGKESKSSTGKVLTGWFGDLFYALVKPPEEREKEKKEEKPLSSTEQSLVDSIEEKARHAVFESQIRLVTSSVNHQKAKSLYNSIAATFSLFDSPGRNGFKVSSTKDIDQFITDYLLRIFPQESNKVVLNTIELSTLFHFPTQKSIPTTQLERQASKQVDGPRNVPETGTALGYNVFRGVKKKINLDDEDRRRHLYAVGQTGTGKSVFLENLAVQDMLNGKGFAFIDPHGDTAENLLSMVPKERAEDVIYFCPADMDYPLGLNLFETKNAEQEDFIIQEAINMLYALYDPNRQGMIGARFERIFTNCAKLLMADPNGGTFIDIPKLLIDPDFMKPKLKYTDDQNVLDFWTKEWPNAQRSNEAGEVTSWVVSKFGAFQSNTMMRNIVGQNESSFSIPEVMNNKKILLVNLSKGRLGELNSRLLGMIFVMKFQAAAMERANMLESEREDFGLYVDEFQNFSTDSFASILSEARKYRLNLIVVNQFTTQLTEEIRDAVFGNVGTVVCFRVGTQDAELLAKQFAPMFDTDDLQRIPNWNTVVRMLIRGVPTQAFSMAALPPLGVPNQELGDALKQLSAAKYGRPRAVVEKEIMERIKTPEKPSDTQAENPLKARPSRPSSGSSFLDDWLDKKDRPVPVRPNPFNNQSQPVVHNLSDSNQAAPTAQPQQPQAIQQPIKDVTHSVAQDDTRVSSSPASNATYQVPSVPDKAVNISNDQELSTESGTEHIVSIR